ncbi:MAG: hypothetical protein IRD7MM_06260 [Candidatus Midichloria mitochondrii]|nr:hypothetical protein [Candidatus Midichloria mitochondrii]
MLIPTNKLPTLKDSTKSITDSIKRYFHLGLGLEQPISAQLYLLNKIEEVSMNLREKITSETSDAAIDMISTAGIEEVI